ncbi:Terminal uridylyltransferase 4 like protein [Argiope bruennichi]|uniref:Terminal uridylyltransferase 4 like protein n=1 Tax=Argiope bruennichi TaxID=94029 RepID=A0A8T0G228_ARGBR|nr:Terminal uridylyltransferase 4 like protein [Argiope bruennichi]
MSFMDKDFDAVAAKRIDEVQKKQRPKMDISDANNKIKKILSKNKNCAPSFIPNKEDTPSNSDILEKQKPEKLPSKKRKEQQPYRPTVGKYKKCLDSKTSNQSPDLTSNSPLNSELKTTQNGDKMLSRNKNSEKRSQNSWDVIELQNSTGNFSDSHSINVINNSLKITTKSSKNDNVLVSDSSEFTFDVSSHGLNGNLTGVYDLPLTNKKNVKSEGISISVPSELTSDVSSPDLNGDLTSVDDIAQPSTITKKFSKIDDILVNGASQLTSDFNMTGPNGNSTSECVLTYPLTTNWNDPFSISDVPILAPDFSSPYANGDFSSVCSFAESNTLFDINWSEDYILPPNPASPNTYVTSEIFETNPYLNRCQLSNLNNLNLEDHFSESQSIHHDKLGLQEHEITSTISVKGNEVKTTASCEGGQFPESQPTGSFEDDQVFDCEFIKKIDQFLHKLISERYMQKAIAENILNDLRKFIKYYFNGNSVKLYGSYLYDAAVSTSNLNLALVSDYPIKNSFLLCIQKKLAIEMKDYKVDPFEENQNPRRSKICFSDNDHGIACELICLGSTVSKYLELNNMLKAVCNFDRRIQNLVIVIKLWAETCEINEVENGKLHPIGFALLVLHYLQQLEKPLLPFLNVSSKNWGLKDLPVRNMSSLGELWLDLLKYYGYEFNWNECVVTVTDKTPVPKSTKSWQLSWIAIEDPFSETNVANNIITSDSAEFITSCFKKSYEYFSSGPCDSDSTSSGSDHNDSQKIRKCSTFKLSDCISRAPPVFFSDDDDSDYENDYVPKQVVPEEPLKFSKISETMMKNVNRVLHEVYGKYKLPDHQLRGRQAFVKDLESYIRNLFPNAKLNLFGSTVNGFAFKRSDLDICMTFEGRDKKENSAASVLKKLVYHLRRRDDLKNVFGLYKAQIPIIKFNVTHQNWHCDLSFYNILAVHNSHLLYKYSMMDERCQILGICLKYLAKKTCIADCAIRTLSSYSYILLTIHFLQQVNPPILPVMPIHDKGVFDEEIDAKELKRRGVLQNRNFWYSEDIEQLKKRYLGNERNTLSVGELWLEMLEYYLKFDYNRAVSITEKEPVPSSSLQRYACLFNIEDPFISKRNLGCIVSQEKAQETRKVFHRTRMLFGCDYPCDKMKILREHFFCPTSLTGRTTRDVECFACGGFGHVREECPKADPFKNRKPWKSSRKSSTNKAQKSTNVDGDKNSKYFGFLEEPPKYLSHEESTYSDHFGPKTNFPPTLPKSNEEPISTALTCVRAKHMVSTTQYDYDGRRIGSNSGNAFGGKSCRCHPLPDEWDPEKRPPSYCDALEILTTVGAVPLVKRCRNVAHWKTTYGRDYVYDPVLKPDFPFSIDKKE